MPLLVVSTVATAQARQQPRLQVIGQAIVALTHVDPVPRDSALTELRLVQPVLMLRATTGGLAFHATLNLEGSTIPNGELAPGAWGEGFVDRRHPHTYAHELILGWSRAFGGVRAGIAAGKGFAPFGTDDPMSRPTLRYPVNHHFSQILERALVMGSIAVGPIGFEAAAFNGDEPERPGQWPNLDRFGDSWSARVTLLPVTGVETQISLARVASPEHRQGAASEQWKWSASGRIERSLGNRPVYGLIEWARTSELESFFVFQSMLLETAITLGRHRPYARFERTERPEEQRLVNPFRSQRPHLENSILGITRWTIATAGYAVAGPGWRLRVWPFVELSRAGVTNITGGVFDPTLFYGRRTIWSFTVGLRLDAGMLGHRMGRYGVLSTIPHTTVMEH